MKCLKCGGEIVIKRLRTIEGSEKFIDFCKSCGRKSLKEVEK